MKKLYWHVAVTAAVAFGGMAAAGEAPLVT